MLDLGRMEDWSAFYSALNKMGPGLLRGVHRELVEFVKMEAEDTDAFWSDWLQGGFSKWRDGDVEEGARDALTNWRWNVQAHLRGVIGPDSLVEHLLGTPEHRQELLDSVEEITIALDDWHLRTFLDSIALNSNEEENRPEFLVQMVLEPYGKSVEGTLVRAVSIPWSSIVRLLRNDWQNAHQIPPHRWEELIAAAFDRAGYDEVTLTPRSKDLGRDVIAVKNGVGAVRILASVKAYSPGRPVRHDDVRALAGVLHADHRASKGIITTTSTFAPGITKDPLLMPLIPFRLELMDGIALRKWLEDLALSR